MIQLLWFKRDLRVDDHAPLARAAACGAVLPLYVIEPDILAAPDYDALHWDFVRESLLELSGRLAELGQPLIIRIGDPVDVFAEFHRKLRIGALWSHEETGNALTYARDRRVAAWCAAQGLPWHELAQHGVFRRLSSRDGWARSWERRMTEPRVVAPPGLMTVAPVDALRIPSSAELGLTHFAARGDVQPGGTAQGEATLRSFFGERGLRYTREMSSPAIAAQSCSRLSPHLAYGTLSLRSVVAATRVELESSRTGPRRQSLASFLRRLHWHCHFIQKLESEPAIETQCFNRACEELRGSADPVRLHAWLAGETGYPFIDACMRALRTHGWINFRMRAMLVSFAAYDLWLDWRALRDPLARNFLDYEPGIHYSQLQMQSGTTGINTPRLYNPLKQALDHDPGGEFTRRYVPELAGVPSAYLHTPWLMDAGVQVRSGCVLGRDYPVRLVRHEQRVSEVRAILTELRGSARHRTEAGRVYDRHGSRAGPRTSARERAHRARRVAGADAQPAETSDNQLTLVF